MKQEQRQEIVSELQNIVQGLDQKSSFVLAAVSFIASGGMKFVEFMQIAKSVSLGLAIGAILMALWPRSNTGINESSWPNFKNLEAVNAIVSANTDSTERLSMRLVSLAKIIRAKTFWLRISLFFLFFAVIAMPFS